MSREIKFRGWIPSEGRYGVLGAVEVKVLLDRAAHEARTLGETVLEQYTGLKDKNGVEIYEGDILGDNAIVEWFTNLVWDGGGSLHSGFYCKKWAEYWHEGDPIDMSFHTGFNGVEVIGNIHENPELLGSGDHGGA